MYAQAAIKRNIIPRNGAYRIVNRDVHFCTPPCSSLRSKKHTSLGRITLDTATDPCMDSGHILVVMFDVLVQIYEAYGYSACEAASMIVEHNLYGLDIDECAVQPHVYAIVERISFN